MISTKEIINEVQKDLGQQNSGFWLKVVDSQLIFAMKAPRPEGGCNIVAQGFNLGQALQVQSQLAKCVDFMTKGLLPKWDKEI